MTYDKIRKLLEKLPGAEERSLIVRGKPNPVRSHKAIWDTTNNRLVGVVSRKYTLVQHKDAFEAVIKAIEQLRMPVHTFNAYSIRGIATLRIVFEGMEITPGDSRPILMGIEARNSYTASLSLYLGGFLYRLICKNGMTTRRLVEPYKIKHLGRDKETLVHKIEQEVPIILEKIPDVLKYIKKARMKEVGEKNAAKIIEAYGVGKKRGKKILNSFGAEEHSLWGLYNAFTLQATREKKRAAEEWLQLLGERILLTGGK